MLLLISCCVILVVSSILVFTSDNPVTSVLFLIVCFFSGSFIFILLNADFLGLVILIVYVGAIAVLFLFIVMTVNIKQLDNDNTSYFLIGCVFFFFFFSNLYYYSFFVVANTDFVLPLDSQYELESFNILDNGSKHYFFNHLGFFFYDEYSMLLYIVGLLLFATVVAVIHLTNFKTGFSKRKQYNQLSRNSNLYIIYMY